uniref:DNA primase n=1 Tax=viral metagenome TaxID=1070528 RepID=A0A6C0BF81_9ZZZZ
MIEERFYKKLTNGPDAMLERINLGKDHIPVCLEVQNPFSGGDPIKKFTYYKSPLLLFKATASLSNSERCHYEIIMGDRFQKHYVDIDIPLKDDSIDDIYSHTKEEKIAIADKIVECYRDSLIKIRPQIQLTDILVLSSHDATKRSFHIVVDRWCVQSATLNKELFNEVIQNVAIDTRKYLDDRMYKCVQQFRLFLSTKCGKNRQLIVDSKHSTWAPTHEIKDTYTLIKEIFLASLVSVTDTCVLLPMEMKEKTFTVSSKELDSNDYKAIISAFNNFHDKSSFEIGALSGSFLLLKRKRQSYCDHCMRSHQNENPFLYVGPVSGNIYFNCRRGEGSTIIGNIKDTYTSSKEITTMCPKLEDVKSYISTSGPVQINNFVDSGILSLSENDIKTSQTYISKHTSVIQQVISTTTKLDISKNVSINKNRTDIPETELSAFKKQVEEKKLKWMNKLSTRRPDVVFQNLNII